MNDTKKFLNQIMGNLPKDCFFNICIFKNGKPTSTYFQNIDKAVNFVQAAAKKQLDIFLMTGFTRADLGPHGKGKKSDIVGMMGLHADLDFKLSKEGADTACNQALDFLYGFGADPSIIVHSGGGFHPWLLFKEPLMIENGDFQPFEIMNKRYQKTIDEKSSKFDWKALDSCFECNRLLRIPGTFNCKPEHNLRPVKLLKTSGRRYGDLSEFDEFLIPEDQIQVSSAPPEQALKEISAGLDLNPHAEPPADMLDEFCNTDPRFKATWQRKRTKKDLKDQSHSGYSMALVNFLVQAEAEDQLIADFVIAFYRRHGGDMKKATRRDYIPRTIAKVRRDYAEKDADEIIESANLLRDTPDNISKKKITTALFLKLGIRIVSITRYIQDDPQYVIKTDKGDIRVNCTKDLITRTRFRNLIAAKLKFFIRISEYQWPFVVQLLLDLCTDAEIGPEGKILENIPNWIREYINRNATAEDFYKIIKSKYPYYDRPFYKDGHYYIKIEYFLAFLEGRSYTFNLTSKKLAVDLAQNKCKSKPFNNLKIDGNYTTRRFWKIPHLIAVPEVETEDEEDAEEQPEYPPHLEDLSEEFQHEAAKKTIKLKRFFDS